MQDPSQVLAEAPADAREQAADILCFDTLPTAPASGATFAPPIIEFASPAAANATDHPPDDAAREVAFRRAAIISQHLTEPSRALSPGDGVRLDVGYLETTDGLHLRTAHFRPWRGRIRNTFVFLPGKSAPIEGLQDQIEYIVRRGHQVLTLDWRSQGLSSRTYRTDVVHVNDFASEYARDLRLFLDQIVRPEQKGSLVAVAYSMGGAILITALTQGIVAQENFDRIFLLAPMTEARDLTTRLGRMALRLATVHHSVGWGGRYCWTKGDLDWDEELKRYDCYTARREELERVAVRCRVEPRLASGGPSWAWIAAYRRYVASLRQVPDHAIEVSTVILLAENDRIVSNEATVAFAQRCIRDHRIVELPDAHALELGGPATIARIGDMMLSMRMPSRTTADAI